MSSPLENSTIRSLSREIQLILTSCKYSACLNVATKPELILLLSVAPLVSEFAPSHSPAQPRAERIDRIPRI